MPQRLSDHDVETRAEQISSYLDQDPATVAPLSCSFSFISPCEMVKEPLTSMVRPDTGPHVACQRKQMVMNLRWKTVPSNTPLEELAALLPFPFGGISKSDRRGMRAPACGKAQVQTTQSKPVRALCQLHPTSLLAPMGDLRFACINDHSTISTIAIAFQSLQRFDRQPKPTFRDLFPDIFSIDSRVRDRVVRSTVAHRVW